MSLERNRKCKSFICEQKSQTADSKNDTAILKTLVDQAALKKQKQSGYNV